MPKAKVKKGDVYFFKATVASVNEFENSRSVTFHLPTYGTPITIHESTFEYALEVGSLVKEGDRR